MQPRRSYAIDENGSIRVIDFPPDLPSIDLSKHYNRSRGAGFTPTILEVDHHGGWQVIARESGPGADAAKRELLSALNEDLTLEPPNPRSFDRE